MSFCVVVMLSHFVVVKVLDQRTTLFNRLKYSFHVASLPFMTTYYPATSSLESKATPWVIIHIFRSSIAIKNYETVIQSSYPWDRRNLLLLKSSWSRAVPIVCRDNIERQKGRKRGSCKTEMESTRYYLYHRLLHWTTWICIAFCRVPRAHKKYAQTTIYLIRCEYTFRRCASILSRYTLLEPCDIELIDRENRSIATMGTTELYYYPYKY